MAVDFAYGNFGDLPLIDAASLLKSFAENGLDASAFYGKANSFTCPLGEAHGYGYLLMFRRDVDTLMTEGEQSLKRDLTFGFGDKKVTFKDLYFKGATRLTTGATDSETAVYLVEVVDARWFLSKSFINKQYNVRTTSDPEAKFYEDSLKVRDEDDDEALIPEEYEEDERIPWTWETMLEDIWGEMSFIELAGTEWFGFPDGWTPPETHPERFRYVCSSWWSAINDAHRRLGLAIRFDPFKHADMFSSVVLGDDDDALETQKTERRNRLVEDGEPQDSDTGFIPATVVVCFKCRYSGSPEERQTLRPFYTREYDAVSSECFQGTKHVIFDDLEAVFDDQESASPSNETEVHSRAIERGIAFYKNLIDGSARSRQCYAGFWDFQPGSKVKVVSWLLTGGIPQTVVQNFAAGEWSREWEEPGGGDCPKANARLQLAVLGRPTGGTFIIEIHGELTGPIAFNASNDDLKAAIEALPNIDTVEVIGASSLPNATKQIVITGDLENTNVNSFNVSFGGLTGGTGVGGFLFLIQKGHPDEFPEEDD